MTKFEDVLENILEEYARRDSDGEFDTWEETDAFVKEKAEVLLAYVKEEPVSEDLISVAKQYIDSHVFGNEEDKFTRSVLVDMFCSGAKWQKEKEYTCYEEAFEDGAKWKAEQFEKNRLAACDRQTDEEAEIGRDFVTSIIEKERRQPTFDDAIKYGMRLKKDETMAKAIDAHVNYAWSGLSFGGFNWSKTGLDLGDKCKLIIIKEG